MASYNTLGAPQPPPARPDPRPWAVLGAACLTAAAILSLSMVSASPSALYTAVSATTVTKPSVATPAPWQRGATAQRRTEAYVDQWTEGPGAAQAPRLRVGNGIFQTPLAHAVYRPTLAMFGIMGVLMMGLRYLQPSTRAPTGASAAAPSALCMAAVTGTEITREDVPLDQEEGEAPLNAYTKDTPFEGVVRSVEKITGPDALGETYHIVVDTAGQVQCREGHCYGVIPPGVDVDKDGNEKPHYARLYTVAASRYGDTCDGQTTSLCVKKIAWWDPSIGGMKKELCSHFLCEATPGTTLTMTGPAGKAMLLDEDPDAVHICVATGTGIAPYRAFWRRMFYENVPGYQFKGRVLLYFGDGNADGLLYAQELADLQGEGVLLIRDFIAQATYPDQFRVVTAYSEEEQTPAGEKMFVQDKMRQDADEIFALLQDGAHMYCSGSKFMMPGITEMLQEAAAKQGLQWEEVQKGLKGSGKWHEQVY